MNRKDYKLRKIIKEDDGKAKQCRTKQNNVVQFKTTKNKSYHIKKKHGKTNQNK